MKRRTILLYWLLLLVPTLVISIAAIRLLRHEQERMQEQARVAALERAEGTAETLKSSVAGIEDDLSEALRRLPAAQVPASLTAWQAANPLIRNVFVWERRKGLQYPLAGQTATRDEQLFVTRYDALFTGRVPWKSAALEVLPAANSSPVGAVSYTPSESTVKRRAIAGLASPAATGAGGWIPWYSENQLHLLGWVQASPDGPVIGVELEFMVLLSRLITLFPATPPNGYVFALVDDAGKIAHQVGAAPIDGGAKPEVTVSLAPYLPHWEVALFRPAKFMPGPTPRAFLILAGLLLGIFVAAILLGGALLTWQAHLHMRDARQKTSFVSNVSHELKTPLTSIRMYAELLYEGRVKDEIKRRQYLEVIATEAQRLTRLVNNVLDFGRLEEGRKKYRFEDLDIADFLRQFAEASRLRMAEAGLPLQTEIPDIHRVVPCDRDALEQALLNLIDNAAKYAAAGRELTIRLSAQDGACRIAIMDRGPGVPVAHREKIFEKFHRVDDSLTAAQPGSGLGLTIARDLIRGMGGDLLYSPRPEGGSCFTIVLPAAISKGIDQPGDTAP